MGNSQSTEAPRRQSHKLSKPRTGSHATAGLLSPSGFSNSTGRFSNARLSAALPPPPSPVSSPSLATVEAMTEFEQPIERRPSVQQKESKRRSLFRSKSSQGASKPPERRNSSIGPGSRFADKPSRANSMTYESSLSYYGQHSPDIWPGATQTRASWNYDLTSYEAKRLLNLVEEPLEHVTTLSEHNMTVVTETTWKSSNPTNPASTPITRANSDVSLYMPVRRRSVIQKPGVATRSNSTRDGFTQSRPNFRYSHPPTPNMSRQPSFESYRSGVLSMPPKLADPDFMPRVVTPCEEKYQSIGAFKLGSLRITNGAASPVSPEVEKHRKGDDLGSTDAGGRADYFSVTQAQETGTAPGNALQIIMQTSAELPKMEAPQPRAVQQSPIGASFQTAEVAANVSGTAAQDLTALVTSVPLEYLAEISFSPFSLAESPPTSPRLQTTSKTTALEDELFEDEPQPEYSSVEVLDVRVDPSAKSHHGQAADDGMTMTFGRTDSGFISIASPVPEIPHKPLTKADSGYSSNVSLRSFQLKSQGSERDLTLSLEKQFSQASQRSTLEVSAPPPVPPQREAPPPPVLPPQGQAPPPPVPPKDFLPSSPTSQTKLGAVPKKSVSAITPSKGGFLSTPNALRKNRNAPSPINSGSPSLAGPKSPESLPLTPLSSRSTKSDKSGSTLSIGSASQKPSKLQRLLSGARRPTSGPLTVHTTHVFEKTGIPSIPQDVEHKLHEHTGMFPITTKRLALKPRSSMDTLKTIFSVGSVEASLDAVNSLHRVSGTETEDPHESKEPLWRQTFQSVPSHIAHVAAHVIPRKPIARKPIPNRQELSKEADQVEHKPAASETVLTVEAELSTYNSVNTSLGKNAYDVALFAGADERAKSVPPTKGGRTMSLTLSMEQKLNMRLASARSSAPDLSSDVPSPSLPSPLLARALYLESKTRTPPPVSMMNRQPMSLRVPPPLRSQSSTSSFNRKASRESIQRHPSAPSLSRQTSRDNIHSYPSYQPASGNGATDNIPPVPPMDPRRIMAFRQSQTSQFSQLKTPNWDIQTDHDITRRSSRTSVEGESPHNSFSSQGQDGLGIQRSASAQGWKVRTGQPPLRHRSSYDGYSHQQNRMQHRNPPSMSNGYTAPSKPVFDRKTHQLDLSAGQWSQDGRYPPYVPRAHGHQRHRSVHGHSTNAPFRVLHSYNSPAYRNAPIWG
ncbi:hypothetical protein B0H66DRAFT_82360 [Apodospora peruviana]|uniref:Proteophosphoglycan ppg4 n=1 Tax=Apodospora peruviana TaxID=516989 RepID=A0AAE0MFS6_9PEZI|nr:hypothetical protein B0H66DRAFT_82360 [Apodospora peruviana]